MYPVLTFFFRSIFATLTSQEHPSILTTLFGILSTVMIIPIMRSTMGIKLKESTEYNYQMGGPKWSSIPLIGLLDSMLRYASLGFVNKCYWVDFR